MGWEGHTAATSAPTLPWPPSLPESPQGQHAVHGQRGRSCQGWVRPQQSQRGGCLGNLDWASRSQHMRVSLLNVCQNCPLECLCGTSDVAIAVQR